MRISDWSSDVCSSDLVAARLSQAGKIERQRLECLIGEIPLRHQLGKRRAGDGAVDVIGRGCCRPAGHAIAEPRVFCAARYGDGRSEEHTSELQSLMRTSYAGFCLKKKNIRF